MVSHIRTFYRPKSVYVGCEAFSGGADAVGSVARVGPSPIMRLPIDRWSDIETAPGVYDWGASSLDDVVDAHRSGAQALAPVLIAGAIPAFYTQSVTNPSTQAAAQAFAAAYAAHGVSLAGPFMIAVDPRVQESVFAATGANPDDWATLFTLAAGSIRSADPAMKVLPDVVGDGHSSYLPGAWLTTAMSAADVLGIEESSPLISSVLSDLDFFIAGPAAGKKVWIVGTAFSTYTGSDARAHGTEADQATYFGSLLTNVVVGYPSSVEAVIQTSLADAGTNPLWEEHLGVTTMGMAIDKPAVGVFRNFVDAYPPYHPVFQTDRSAYVQQELPFPLQYFSPTDFEYLDWAGVIDMSQVTAVNVDFGVTSPDGYPGYMIRAGNTWRRVPGGLIDIKPYIGNGDVKVRLFVPTTVFGGSVTVQHLRVTPVVDTGIPDVFAPRIESLDVTRKITVHFSDDLDPLTSLDPANYQIFDFIGGTLPVNSVEPVDARTVALRTNRQQPRKYRLIVSGVEDDAGNLMIGASADTADFKGGDFTREDPPPTYRPIDVRAQWTGPGGSLDVRVQFEGASGRDLDVEIFDVRGRLVRSLARGAAASGTTIFSWNRTSDSGAPVAAGVYFIRARTGAAVGQARVTVAR